MKTPETSNPQFSGYPPQWSETERPKFPFPAIKSAPDEKERGPGSTNGSRQDLPVNWDESWFANYE